ncbi:MAG TPA: serine hydrolase, partial [Caulifigura sp.]|nr:serine hydrolase [Caulifigura sp.]
GMVSPAGDLARFCGMMLGEGELDGVRVLSSRSVGIATGNNLVHFPSVPEADQRTRPWGYGWRLNWPAHAASFGDLLPAEVYGHWGATGTLFWIDPLHESAAVILSSQPMEKDRSLIVRISNAIAAALV